MNTNTTTRLSNVRHSLSLAFAALVAGSRSIPLGDNGSLLRELALKSATPSSPSRNSRNAAQPQRPTV